jgi:succinoglycan biosynthesis protein ExoA
MDVHSRYPLNYLLLCYETALRTRADNVGGVVVAQAEPNAYSAELVQALTTHWFGVGNSGFRLGARESPADTVPYGFFRRDLVERIGWFDERLVRAQDYEFNRRIRASGGIIWLNPEIEIYYYNKSTLGEFYSKQMLLDAPYNADMWYLAPHSFAVRHAVTALSLRG